METGAGLLFFFNCLKTSIQDFYYLNIEIKNFLLQGFFLLSPVIRCLSYTLNKIIKVSFILKN